MSPSHLHSYDHHKMLTLNPHTICSPMFYEPPGAGPAANSGGSRMDARHTNWRKPLWARPNLRLIYPSPNGNGVWPINNFFQVGRCIGRVSCDSRHRCLASSKENGPRSETSLGSNYELVCHSLEISCFAAGVPWWVFRYLVGPKVSVENLKP